MTLMSKTQTMIDWNTTDLSRERIDTILGRAWVAGMLAKGTASARIACEVKAAGAWGACEREHYAAYRSLLALLAA